MKIKYVFPILAIIGLGMAIRVVFAGNKKVPEAAVLVEPIKAPFEAHVAGAGVIESFGEDIALSTERSGVIKEVFVKPGDFVSKGQVLLVLDSLKAEADVNIKDAAVLVSEAQVRDAKNELTLWQSVSDRRAVSVYEVKKREYGLQIAEASLKRAKAELESAKVELDKLKLISPVDAQVLKVNARIGEYAETRSLSSPLIIIGETTSYQVRADIDENDAWRISSGAKAKIYVRGNPDINSDVEFIRFDPLVIPKRSLTGDSTERVDTRVLQIIFKLKREAVNVYVGQLVDVFIEAKPISIKDTGDNEN